MPKFCIHSTVWAHHFTSQCDTKQIFQRWPFHDKLILTTAKDSWNKKKIYPSNCSINLNEILPSPFAEYSARFRSVKLLSLSLLFCILYFFFLLSPFDPFACAHVANTHKHNICFFFFIHLLSIFLSGWLADDNLGMNHFRFEIWIMFWHANCKATFLWNSTQKK